MILFLSLSNVTFLSQLYAKCPSTKTRLSEISFLSIIFRYHCVKSVQIRSYFWSVFSWMRREYGDISYLSVFTPNTEKYGPEITPYLDTFHPVHIFKIAFTSNKIFFFSQVNVFMACHLSKIDLQSERKAWFYLAQNMRFFISKTFNFLLRKTRCSLKIAFPEFQKYRK